MGPTESCGFSKCSLKMAQSNGITSLKIGPVGRTLGLPKFQSIIFYVFASQKSPDGSDYTILVQGDEASNFLSVLRLDSEPMASSGESDMSPDWSLKILSNAFWHEVLAFIGRQSGEVQVWARNREVTSQPPMNRFVRVTPQTLVRDE
uniref:Uncharacterized protein n=1 Tax=Nephila pilipes TaxID=299642 RepID=A0A8X6Q0A0_NEPPI|nr:hypothetical protein NPIL_337151 [Nephila pilipes]GFT98476.1 hypothetical protein NPIL_462841 [Nephila pilipes]